MVSYWKRFLMMKSKQRQTCRKSRKSLRKSSKKHQGAVEPSNYSSHQGAVETGNWSLKKHQGPVESPSNPDTRSIHHLSEDLLSEILIRLPVKYILRCRCVHKSWHYLIQTPMFITLHLNHQKTHNSPGLLLFNNAFYSNITLRLDDLQCQEYCPINHLAVLSQESSSWLVHSYGLICVTSILKISMFHVPSQHERGIYLWNPLLGKFITLPDSPIYTSFTFKPRTSWTALAFGFVPQVNDYMLVHIMNSPRELNPNTVVIGVYSLNTNSWKITSQDDVFITNIADYQVVFVNGAAYWEGFNSTQGIVMCFDTKTNLLREVALPVSVKFNLFRSHLVIHPYGESISYFVEDDKLIRFDMWVLREDMKNEFFWEKKMSVDLGDSYREEVLGVRNNGEPIFFKLYKFITYNLDSHKADDFVDSWDNWGGFSWYEENFAPPYSISPFVESLVLLDNDDS